MGQQPSRLYKYTEVFSCYGMLRILRAIFLFVFVQEKVTQAEIDQVWEQFERLDTNQNGFLEFEEVSVECDTNSDGVISP